MLGFGGVCILGLVAAYLVPDQFATHELASLEERATAESALLARAVAPALEFDQLDSATESLTSGRADPEVAWVAIYGANRRVVAKVGDFRPPDALDAIPPNTERWLVIGKSPVERTPHTVAIAIKKTSVYQRQADARTNMVAVALLVAIVALGVSWYVSRRIAEPLERVTEAAGRIASGDISSRLHVEHSRDEVGALSRAFQKMARACASCRADREELDSVSSAAAGMFSEVRQQQTLATQQTSSLEEIRKTLETLGRAADRSRRRGERARHGGREPVESSQRMAERPAW